MWGLRVSLVKNNLAEEIFKDALYGFYIFLKNDSLYTLRSIKCR